MVILPESFTKSNDNNNYKAGLKLNMCSPLDTPLNPYLNQPTGSERDYLILKGFKLDPIETPMPYWAVSIIICIMLFIGFFILIYFLNKSQQLIKLIKSPQSGRTYCILTTCIIRCLQMLLILSIFVQFLRIIFVCMADHFERLVLK